MLGGLKATHKILHKNGVTIFRKLQNAPCSVPTRKAVLFVRSVDRHPRTVRHVVCGLGLNKILRGLSKLVVKRFARFRRSHSLKGILCTTLTSLMRRCSCPIYFGFPIKRIAGGLPLVGKTRMRFAMNGGSIRLGFVYWWAVTSKTDCDRGRCFYLRGGGDCLG